MNEYSCLDTQIHKDGNFSIQPLRKEDIFLIMEWRNQQIDVLRQNVPLTYDQQEKYYNDVIRASFTSPRPEMVLFSYLYNEECIGYGGLVHIDWFNKRGEISFLVNTERSNSNNLFENDFSVYIRLIKGVAFKDLGLHRVHTETYDISGTRKIIMKILEQNGFQYEGCMRDHVVIGNKYENSILHGCLNGD